jgi:transcription elongation GreA/GreB family factor
MTVTVEAEDGKRKSWKIVGEDEADAASGSVSHVSPMAMALFGKRVGDVAAVSGKEWEIVSISAEP